MSPEQETAWQQVEAAAKKEGSLTFYGSSSVFPQRAVQPFQDAWKKDYPDIKVDFLVEGTVADVQIRMEAEQNGKKYVGDVAQSGGTARDFVAKGWLQPANPPAAMDPAAKFGLNPLQDTQKQGYNVAYVNAYAPFIVNTKLVKPEDEPKTHMDLTDPKWKGKIGWFAPFAPGAGWVEYYFSKQMYGPDWVTRMATQEPVVVATTGAMVDQLAAGEFSIGLIGGGGAASIATAVSSGQPIRTVWPEDFSWASFSSMILLTGAPHSNAGRVFINWWLTRSGQQVLFDIGQWVLREDIGQPLDWMKGYVKAKEKPLLSDLPADAGPNTQKEAATYFKK